MRFLAQAVAILAGVGIIGVMPMAAQRGHAGGTQFGGQHFSKPVAHGTQPLGGGRPFPVRTFGPPPLGLRAPAAGFTGIDPGALRSQPRSFGHGHGRNRAPQAFFAPYYYPFLGYDTSGYDAYPPYETAQDPAAQTAAVTGNLLGQQIEDLSAQVEELRNEQEAARAQQTMPAPPLQSAAPAAETQLPQAPPVKLVLRSGQQVQIQNYAVVDGTLWDFTSQPTRRIPVANIDIPASQKATEESGGEFPRLSGKQ